MTERPHNRIVTEHERTTTEVLVAYRMSAFGYNDMPDDAPHDPEELAEVDAEFHNWLEQVKAEAWDKGYTSGRSNTMRRMSDEPKAPLTRNPYRQEEEKDDAVR